MSDDAEPILVVDGLHKRYQRDHMRSMRDAASAIRSELLLSGARNGSERPLQPGEFWALRDLSFRLGRGEALGVIGRNGAGKSTLLRILHGLTKPDGGSVSVEGRTGALIELGASFSAALTGRENVASEAVLFGLGGRHQAELIDAVEEFADIGSFFDAPVETYSSGMQMRLAYATAAHMRPDVLLIDEVIAVGDIAFQRKCVRHVRDFLSSGGALILVTHDLWMLNAVCTRAIEIRHGQVVASGDPRKVLLGYIESLRDDSAAVVALHFDDEDDADPDDTTSLRDLVLASGGDEDAAGLAPLIDEVRLVGPDGTMAPVWGAPATVEVDVVSVAARSDLGWTIALMSATDQVCVAATPAGESGPIELVSGTTTLRATLDAIHLAGGLYHARVALLDAESGEVVASAGHDGRSIPVRVEAAGAQTEAVSQIIGCLSVDEVVYEPWVGPGDPAGDADH